MRRALMILGLGLALVGGVTAAVALASGSSSRDASTSTNATPPVKVWLCHHTGSWKHPYHLIHVSSHAVPAHRRHGDVDPGPGNSCPTTQPQGAKTQGHDGASKGAKAGDDQGNPGSHDEGDDRDD